MRTQCGLCRQKASVEYEAGGKVYRVCYAHWNDVVKASAGHTKGRHL